MFTASPSAVKSVTVSAESDGPNECRARLDADPNRDPGAAWTSLPRRPHQFLPRAYRARRVVFQEREIEGDHLVSHQLVNPGIAVNQHARRNVIEAVHQTAELRGRHPFGQSGGASYVRKEQGEFNLSPATIDSGNRLTIVAKSWVLP